MFKFKVFHTPKPRQFYHRPIYWDAEEERRQQRNEQLNRTESGEFKSSIKRGSFRRSRWDAPNETPDMHAERRRSNVRLALIAGVLLTITALLFFAF